MARKAGAIFGRLAAKDIGLGPKNPAWRLAKIFKMPKEMQKSLFGDDLEDVIAEYKEYEKSLAAVTAAGVASKEWVADTIKQKIDDLFNLVNAVEGCHEALTARVLAMDSVTGASRKGKQAEDRNTRQD
eukprot:12209575-Heterocapsa_arctica.AAC.1